MMLPIATRMLFNIVLAILGWLLPFELKLKAASEASTPPMQYARVEAAHPVLSLILVPGVYKSFTRVSRG